MSVFLNVHQRGYLRRLAFLSLQLLIALIIRFSLFNLPENSNFTVKIYNTLIKELGLLSRE